MKHRITAAVAFTVVLIAAASCARAQEVSFTDSDGVLSGDEGSTIDAPFSVSPALTQATTVFYAVDYDTADADDHEHLSGEVELPVGATAGTIRVSITDDADVELPRETFDLRFTVPGGSSYTLGTTSSVTVNIREGICDRSSDAVRGIWVASRLGVIHDSCGDFTSEDLAGTSDWLGMNQQNLTSLKVGDFSGLTAMPVVLLNDNNFEQLPAGVFSGLDSLWRLDLHNNQLTTLPSGIFMGLDRLRELRLDGNQFDALPEGLFLGVRDLAQVNLGGNPSSPLTLTPRLQYIGPELGDIPGVLARLTLAEGAPFDINVEFEVTGGNGAVAPDSDRIDKGDAQSLGSVIINQITAPPVRVTLSVSDVPDQGLLEDGTVGCTSGCYQGLATGVGEPFVIDIVAPSVSDVAFRSTPASGDAYVAQDGETISVGVRFDEDVVVSSGSPVLRLDVGSTMRDALYVPSLSSSTVLVFSYRLAPEDSDDDGIGFAGDALNLNGARITDLFDNNARLGLIAGAVMDHPEHKVVSRVFALRFEPADTVVKPGGSTEVRLILGNAAALTEGEEIIVTLAPGTLFDASLQRPALAMPPNSAITVTLSAAADALPGSSTLTASGALTGARVVPGELTVTVLEREITVLFEPAEVELAPGAGSNPGTEASSAVVVIRTEPELVRDEVVVLTFVAFDDRGNQIASTAAYAKPSEVRLQPGYSSTEVRVFSSNKEVAWVRPQRDSRSTVGEGNLRLRDLRVIFIDVTSPSVSDAAFRSMPASGDAYSVQAGETISVEVRFDEDVVVSNGIPVLRLNVGGTVRDALYDPSSSSSTVLVFSYQLAPGDSDDDGVGFAADALTLNGARITDLDGNNARLGLGAGAVMNHPEHKVAPRVFALRFEPAETVLRPGVLTEVQLILGNAAALTEGEEIIVTLAPGTLFDASLQRPALAMPPNSAITVTLSAAADALPGSSTLTASGALTGARVVPGELTVTVLEREITVLFEPAEVELVSGAENTPGTEASSAVVVIRTEPELVQDEVVVLTFVALDDRNNQIASAAAYVEPPEVRLQQGNDSTEVRVFSSDREIARVRPQRGSESTVEARKLRLRDLHVAFPNFGLQLRVKVFLEGALE